MLAASPFLGEGHRKVGARLRAAGVRSSSAAFVREPEGSGCAAAARAAA